MKRAGGAAVDKKGNTELTLPTLIQVIVSALVVIGLMHFGQRVVEAMNNTSQQKQLDELSESIENAKDYEPSTRFLDLKGKFLYGFSYGSDSVRLNNGKMVAKPTTAICKAGPCLCICDEGCKLEPEIYCEGIKEINVFLADTTFSGENKGDNIGEMHSVALSSDDVLCTQTTRISDKLIFSEC